MQAFHVLPEMRRQLNKIFVKQTAILTREKPTNFITIDSMTFSLEQMIYYENE